MHKSKLNTNGTFSVGKTWRLAELRSIQVVNVCPAPQPSSHFNLTFHQAARFQYHTFENVPMADRESRRPVIFLRGSG